MVELLHLLLRVPRIGSTASIGGEGTSKVRLRTQETPQFTARDMSVNLGEMSVFGLEQSASISRSKSKQYEQQSA